MSFFSFSRTHFHDSSICSESQIEKVPWTVMIADLFVAECWHKQNGDQNDTWDENMVAEILSGAQPAIQSSKKEHFVDKPLEFVHDSFAMTNNECECQELNDDSRCQNMQHPRTSVHPKRRNARFQLRIRKIEHTQIFGFVSEWA